MSRIQSLLLFSALPLAACSGDGGSSQPTPEGPHHTYVVSEASVPVNNTQAREFGLDLNGDKSPDNQLGMVLSTLGGQGFDVQGAIAKAIGQGDIILLIDLQTGSYASTSGAGLQVKLGDKATAMPAPCTGTADTACRHHLDGTGRFTIAAGSPDNAAVSGKVIGGTFDGGPGNISLKIALGGPEGVQLDLIGARAKATGMSDTGIDSVILAGALPQDDLNTKVIPAIHSQIGPLVKRDCPGTVPPDCGCAAGNPTGRTILNLFDTSPKDCTVTVDEIKNNSLIQSLLAPDVEIEGTQALSVGIKVKAVSGAF
ncbi:MAG TPA: hypothetical protein VN253_06765 [Kofleriaceae bacterium]|nr:hypothetical protein [Kofleriaceae bacterium]